MAPRRGRRERQTGAGGAAHWDDLARKVSRNVAAGELIAASLPARELLSMPAPSDRDPQACEADFENATIAVVDADLRRGKVATAGRVNSRLYYAQTVPPDSDPLRLPRVTRTTEVRNLAMLALLMTMSRIGLNEANAMARVALWYLADDLQPALRATTTLVLRLTDARCAEDPRAAYAAIDDAANGIVPTLANQFRPWMERPVQPTEEVTLSAAQTDQQAVALAFAYFGAYHRAILSYTGSMMGILDLGSRVVGLCNIAQLRWELGLDTEEPSLFRLAGELADAVAIPTATSARMKTVVDQVDLDLRLASDDDDAVVGSTGWHRGATESLSDRHCSELGGYASAALISGNPELVIRLADAAARLPEANTEYFDNDRYRSLTMACGLAASRGPGNQAGVIALLDKAVTTTDKRVVHEQAERLARAARVAEHVAATEWAIEANQRAREMFESLGNVARPPVLRERLKRLASQYP